MRGKTTSKGKREMRNIVSSDLDLDGKPIQIDLSKPHYAVYNYGVRGLYPLTEEGLRGARDEAIECGGSIAIHRGIEFIADYQSDNC